MSRLPVNRIYRGLIALLLSVCALSSVDAQTQKDDSKEKLLREIEKMLDEASQREAASREELEKAEKRIRELEQQARELRQMVARLRQAMTQRGAAGTQRGAAGVERASNDRPFIGIGFTPLEEGAADRVGIESGQGILITQVYPGSPAQMMGLQPGDVITEIQGKPVEFEEFSKLMASYKPGDEVKVQYARMSDDGPVRFRGGLTLASRKKFLPDESDAPEPQAEKRRSSFGVTVDEYDDGIVISSVTPMSNASVAGLEEGDRWLSLNGMSIRTVEDCREALGSIYVGQRAEIIVERNGTRYQAVIRWGDDQRSPQVISKSMLDQKRQPAVLGVEVEERERGVAITMIERNSSAAKMGLRNGDLIVEANDQPVRGLDGLKEMFSGLYAGDRLTLTIVRGGERMKLSGRLQGK